MKLGRNLSTSVRNLYFVTTRLLCRIGAQPEEALQQFGVKDRVSIAPGRCRSLATLQLAVEKIRDLRAALVVSVWPPAKSKIASGSPEANSTPWRTCSTYDFASPS